MPRFALARLFLALAFSIVTLSAMALTEDQASSLGLAALRGDKVALLVLKEAAQDNDPAAQESMGFYYEASEDYAKAVPWYHKAAKQGNVDAQYNLGWLYSKGEGVPLDYAEAVIWYRMAAENGNAKAQSKLGTFYDNGLGVSQDYAEAATWYRKAVEQGDAAAQNSLAGLYVDGRGVPVQRVLAYALYSVSAANDASPENPAMDSRNDLAKTMTIKEIEAGQALAEEMMKPGNLRPVLDRYVGFK